MLKKRLLYFFFCLAFINITNAQGNLSVYKSKMEHYRYSKYLDSTKFYFKKTLPIVLKQKDSVAIFKAYKHLGDAYEQHHLLDSTLLMYDICDRYIPKNNLRLKAFLLNDRSYTFGLLHDYETATQLTFQSFKLAEKSGDRYVFAIATTSLADGFSKIKMNSKAEQYYSQAISLSEKISNRSILHQVYRYYAIHLIENKKFDKAFIYLKKANKITFKLKDSISMAYNWYYLMDCYWYKNQKDSCFYYAKKAEKIWEKCAENLDLASVCMKQGECYLKLKNYKKSEFYLKKANKYILNDLYFNEKLYSDFADLYNQNGNSKRAFYYLQKAKNTVEQLKEDENKSKVISLNIKFEADKKEILLQKQNKISELAVLKADEKSSQFRVISFVALLLLIILTIIVVAYNKIKTSNQLLFQANAKLENLVNQKKTLLNEIHHRVKNNLTTLKSLLFLQAKASDNDEVKKILRECQFRIQSMAFIHQKLYEDAENELVDFYSFIEQLFDSLELSYKKNDKNIDVIIEKNNVKLDISIAIFLGLVLNELATNSYKYAFANQDSGIISLILNDLGDTIEIIYSDNGCGLTDGFNEKTSGFGFKLIRILVEQINGKLEYNYINNLSIFKITFDNAK